MTDGRRSWDSDDWATDPPGPPNWDTAVDGDWEGTPAIGAASPKSVSTAPLLIAIALAVLGIALSRFATPTNTVAPVLGWLLCTFGAVPAVALHQRRDLAAAFESIRYRPPAAAAALRTVGLVLATVGILMNSYAIAQWVATR